MSTNTLTPDLCQRIDAYWREDKPVIFAFHAYPWLINRLTYRRHNHDNIHVRGYKEARAGNTSTDTAKTFRKFAIGAGGRSGRRRSSVNPPKFVTTVKQRSR